MSGVAPNWVTLAKNETNLGLFKINFSAFWLGEKVPHSYHLWGQFDPIWMSKLTSLYLIVDQTELSPLLCLIPASVIRDLSLLESSRFPSCHSLTSLYMKSKISSKILYQFYRLTIEFVLYFSNIAWYNNLSRRNELNIGRLNVLSIFLPKSLAKTFQLTNPFI